MHLQGHGKVRPGFDEAAHPEFRIAIPAKNLDLYRMYQRMEQGAQRDVLVEDDYIAKCERIQVADLGGFEPGGTDLREEGRSRDASAPQLENANLLQKAIRKMRAKHGFVLRAERAGDRQIVLALLSHVVGEPLDGLPYLLWGGFRVCRHFTQRNPGLDMSIEIVQRRGGLSRFTQHFSPAEADEIIGGIVQAKLVDGAMRAQQLQLCPLQFGVHLLNRVIRFTERRHLQHS